MMHSAANENCTKGTEILLAEEFSMACAEAMNDRAEADGVAMVRPF